MTSDIKDSEIYTDLIHQIAPKVNKTIEKTGTRLFLQGSGVNKSAMQKSDMVERATVMLDQADKIGCKQFVTPKVLQADRQKCKNKWMFTFRTLKMVTRS